MYLDPRRFTINKDKTHIGFRTKETKNYQTGNTRVWFDNFEINPEGVIIKAPRGYAKEYKGKKISNLHELPPTVIFGNEV